MLSRYNKKPPFRKSWQCDVCGFWTNYLAKRVDPHTFKAVEGTHLCLECREKFVVEWSEEDDG